ncbi:hypothetical protein MTO96_048938 [Rhipicephalus appendiculatus]
MPGCGTFPEKGLTRAAIGSPAPGLSCVRFISQQTTTSFKYALTRAVNSDPVESLFSCYRQFNGGNDRVDARTAVFTAEKLLKVGILEAARSGNAPSSSECQAALKFTSTLHGERIPAIPDEALAVLWKIQHVMKYDEVPVQFDFTALVYLAGYLAFVCEEKAMFCFPSISPDLSEALYRPPDQRLSQRCDWMRNTLTLVFFPRQHDVAHRYLCKANVHTLLLFDQPTKFQSERLDVTSLSISVEFSSDIGKFVGGQVDEYT